MVEKYCLLALTETITAAFSSGPSKIIPLKTARTHIHTVAHLFRSEHELAIVHEYVYLRLSEQLVEIGKMLSGWIVSQTHKEP